MLLFPNAKINIGLNVIEKRSDGYHNIQTIFYPINCCDALEFIEANDNKTELTFSGLLVEGEIHNNLIIRAFRELQKVAKLPELKIHLHKNIPMGAGLGGGSSDAAFMLKGLNDFFELKLEEEKLIKIASKLGADCAFFIKNQPQMGEGIGDILSPVKASLKGKFLVLIKPPVSVSTATAYAGVKPQKPLLDLKQVFENEPITNWKEKLSNDFELSVFKLFPEIEALKELLYQKGALYASMSGSGSSVYGVFEEETIMPEPVLSDFFTWQGKLD